MFYEQLKKACSSNNTTVTTILKEFGLSTSNTGKWKNGGYPSVDLLLQLSERLNVTTDYLLDVPNSVSIYESVSDCYFIAYVDLLGSKNEDTNVVSNNLSNIYKEIKELSNALTKSKHIDNIIFKAFSDNFLFAIKKDFANDNIYTLVSYLCGLQFNCLLKYNVLLRGGICVGDLSLSEQFVYGNSLIDAVDIEHGIAIYPRIIVKEDIINNDSYMGKSISQFTTQDEYGAYYLDYLSLMNNDNKNIILQNINTLIKNANSTQFNNEENKQKILIKLNWLLNYYNSSIGYDSFEIAAYGADETEGAYIPPEIETT